MFELSQQLLALIFAAGWQRYLDDYLVIKIYNSNNFD